MLHSLATGLYGMDVADTVLGIASGADTPFPPEQCLPGYVGVDAAAYKRRGRRILSADYAIALQPPPGA